MHLSIIKYRQLLGLERNIDVIIFVEDDNQVPPSPPMCDRVWVLFPPYRQEVPSLNVLLFEPINLYMGAEYLRNVCERGIWRRGPKYSSIKVQKVMFF